MKLTALKQRSRWHPQLFTLSGIGRDELSGILQLAKEGMEEQLRLMEQEQDCNTKPTYQYTKDRLAEVTKMLEFVDSEDGMTRLTPLEL